jgi:hypothetical protein
VRKGFINPEDITIINTCVLNNKALKCMKKPLKEVMVKLKSSTIIFENFILNDGYNPTRKPAGTWKI